VEPGCIDAYQDLGNLLTASQRYDEARAVYASLTAARSDYFHGHWRLGWVYAAMDNPSLSLGEMERSYQLAPEDYRTLNSLGICYSELGNWKVARDFWERAFLVRPSCASSSNVGNVLYYEGRFSDSARYYQYALEYCDTTDYFCWGNLACALYWTDDRRPEGITAYHKAIGLAEEYLAQMPDERKTIARLADYYAMVDEDQRAREMIDRSAGANDMEVWFRLACAYASMGDEVQAIDFIGKAVRAHYPVHEIKREPLFRNLVRDARLRSVLEAAEADGDDR
jgi:tetratricopeptide (TPR) repeat protein